MLVCLRNCSAATVDVSCVLKFRFNPAVQAEELRRRLRLLKDEAVKWMAAVATAFRETRRLKLLDAPVLLRFIQACAFPEAESLVPFVLLW
jgi:hypothetical protein